MQKFYEMINSFLTSLFFLHLLFCNCHAPMERYSFWLVRKKIMKYSYSIYHLTSQFSSLNIFSVYANAIKVCDIIALYFMFAINLHIHIL